MFGQNRLPRRLAHQPPPGRIVQQCRHCACKRVAVTHWYQDPGPPVAQASGLATVATRVSAIPELIDDGATGVLVPPQDPMALAAALSELASDPSRRAALGSAGRDRVRTAFGHDAGLNRLAARFGLTAGAGLADVA